MFKKTEFPIIEICRGIDTTPYFWCNEAVLLEVKNGKGALRWICQEFDADYKAQSALMLNDKPILQASQPGCPTCEGLLATGYGIENMDCSELREAADKINAPYAGINQAVSAISPILGLLQDGMYVLADCDVFPTDGDGRFFWNVPNELTLYSATSCCATHIDDDFEHVNGIPAYIYPSQNTDKFDTGRVKYYQGLLSDRQRFPRAIAYHCQEFYSVLLDGHHKSAACALNGETVPALVIIPLTGISYGPDVLMKTVEDKINFSGIELPVSFFTGRQMDYIRNIGDLRRCLESVSFSENALISRDWESEYLMSALKYPNVKELSEEIVLETAQIHYSDAEKWLEDAVGVNAQKLKSVIRYYLRTDEQKAMTLAMRCAKLNVDADLMKTAFQTLALFRDNADIERFFIDWLVNDDDSHSVLRKIAGNYWNG